MSFWRYDSAYRYFLYRSYNFWFIIWGIDNIAVRQSMPILEITILTFLEDVPWFYREYAKRKEEKRSLVMMGRESRGKNWSKRKEETGGTGGREGRGSKKAVKWTGGSSSEHKQNGNSRFRKGSDGIKCDEFEIKKCISYRCIST